MKWSVLKKSYAPKRLTPLIAALSIAIASLFIFLVPDTSAVAQQNLCPLSENGFAGLPITITLTYDNPLAPTPAPDPLALNDDFSPMTDRHLPEARNDVVVAASLVTFSVSANRYLKQLRPPRPRPLAVGLPLRVHVQQRLQTHYPARQVPAMRPRLEIMEIPRHHRQHN